MNPIRLRWLAATLVLAFAPAAHAEVDRSAVVRKLMTLSGVENQMKPVASQVSAEILTQSQQRSVPGLETVLVGAAQAEFAAPRLLRDIHASLLERYDARNLAAVLRWLTSPTGRRLTSLEERASFELDATRMTAFAESMANNPLPAERMALLERLDASMHITEQAVQMTLAIAHATALTCNVLASSPAAESQLRAALEGQREQIQGALAGMIFVSLAMTYREATDAELTAYITFGETPEGRWYTKAMTKALETAIAGATARTVQSAKQLVSAPAAPSPR